MIDISSRRQLKREIIEDTILVKDAMQEVVVGLLVNISRDGFMTYGQGKLKEGCLYQLELDAPDLLKKLNPIKVGAECLWTKTQDDNLHCWAGFHVIDISPEAVAAVNALLKK